MAGGEIDERPTKRSKSSVIEDEEDGSLEDNRDSFPIQLKAAKTYNIQEYLSTGGKSRNKAANKLSPVPVLCDLNADDSNVVCALSNDHIKTFDPLNIESASEGLSVAKFTHIGISGVRCSRTDPNLFYTSSEREGTIFQWDIRTNDRKPVSKLQLGKDFKMLGESASGIKSILSFDVDSTDRLVCGGTELVGEDSYVLFWDVRSSNLLGSYSESHSDDITAIRFAPNSNKRIATGSTDGLLNVFDITQGSEDDALLYSFNTEESVYSVCWSGLPGGEEVVYCVTHTNDIAMYDVESGDPVSVTKRAEIASVMKRKNADAINIIGCFNVDEKTPRILCSSLAGGCTRSLRLGSSTVEMQAYEWFSEPSNNVLQCAQRFNKAANTWILCYDDGVTRVWKP